MIDASAAGDEVWVAKGTYYPTKNIGAVNTGDFRDQSFVMKAGVKVRGGFVGNEDKTTFDLNSRDFTLNETILSGDLGVLNSVSDNAYHVVIVIIGTAGTTEKIILDGFTVQDGNADGSADEFQVVGNGSYTWGVARNIGAGISLRGASSSQLTEFHNLVMKNNISADNGGAVHLWLSSTGGLSFNNILFKDNVCDGLGGSAVYIKNTQNTPVVYLSKIKVYSNATTGSGSIYVDGNGNASKITAIISNTIFYNNSAEYTNSSIVRGGAALHAGPYVIVTIANSTFYKNQAKSIHGALTFNDGVSTTLNLYNNIFHENMGNSGAIYADVRRVAAANGANQIYSNNLFQSSITPLNNRAVVNAYVLDQINPEPLFVSLNENDNNFLYPIVGSFAIDKGDNGLYTNNISDVNTAKDLLGHDRANGTIDLGAIEWSTVLPVNVSSFSAKLNNNRTNLHWSVGAESNVSHYEVERSQNGLDFSNIAMVKANGLSAYSTTDNSPSLGVNYYRLKTVDKDGSAVYFNKVQSVNVAGLAASVVAVYPNPARDVIKVSGLRQGNYSYKLINTSGATVQQGTLDTKASINVSGLKAGLYILQLSNDNHSCQLKVVKQ